MYELQSNVQNEKSNTNFNSTFFYLTYRTLHMYILKFCITFANENLY